MSAVQTPAPGWYVAGDFERWWDGTAWTEATRPLQSCDVPEVKPPAQGLGITAIIIGLVIPLVGLILGIITLAKRNVPLGAIAILVSVGAWIVWTIALSTS